ncbi:MAG: DMT family transporter [Desulfurellaceae bacterium]|nr:DMT family transporter [Desulfurellaceae bacterium]
MFASPALRAAVAAAAASIFFGGMVFCTRFVIDQTEPLTLAFFRFGIGFVCIAPVLVRSDRPRVRRTDWSAIACLGVLLYALMPILVGAGLQFSYASRGALALASQPVFTLLLARWRSEERLTPVKLFGIALAMGGLGLALSEGPPQTSASLIWAGDAMLFCAALCIAVYNVYSQPQLQRYPAPVFTVLSMGIGALSLAPFTLGLGMAQGWPAFTPSGWIAVLYIGTFGGGIGYALWVWALAHTTPTRVAIFLTLNPLTATLLGGTFLDEPITPRFVIGLLAVLTGIVAVHYPEPRRAG